MAITEMDAAIERDAALASADLLGQLAPPLRISGGPDFILVKRAPGPTPVAGATLWLQNPTNAPMKVQAWLSFEGASGMPDRFVGTLAPLEVGVLAIPVSITFKLQLGLTFTLTGNSAAARVRATTEGHLDRDATAKGILVGMAGLAVFGVGHFRVAHVGGDVGRFFSATWDFSGAFPASVGAEATWTRLWAPADTPNTVFVHDAAPPRAIEREALRGGTWLATLAAFVSAIVGYSVVSSVVGVLPALAVAVVALIAGAYLATALLKAVLPGLFPSEVIGSLVLRAVRE